MAVPRSAFPVPRLDPVSNCHTLAKPLDCPVKYAATIPPADLRDPRGPDGRADGPGRGGVGARRAHGGAVGGSARRAGGDGGVGARDARSHGHDAARPRRAGGAAAASRAALELGELGAPRRDVSPLLRRRVRAGGDRVRRAGPGRRGASREASLAPAVAADRRAGGVDAADSPTSAAPRGRAGCAGRARVRGAAPGAARARHSARGRPRQGARGRAAAGILVTSAYHGRGISDELRHRVFEPYFTTKQDGTGLGLALVRQTVEAHNGSITVADTPGGGATFSIVLSAT